MPELRTMGSFETSKRLGSVLSRRDPRQQLEIAGIVSSVVRAVPRWASWKVESGGGSSRENIVVSVELRSSWRKQGFCGATPDEGHLKCYTPYGGKIGASHRLGPVRFSTHPTTKRLVCSLD